jgi:hypothetical protein
MRTKVITVPYAMNGDLLHYPTMTVRVVDGVIVRSGEPDWLANEPFTMTLQLQDLVRSGRSAKYVEWREITAAGDLGRTYPMFVKELVTIAAAGRISRGGVVNDRWMVAKRGQNYGIRLAQGDE